MYDLVDTYPHGSQSHEDFYKAYRENVKKVDVFRQTQGFKDWTKNLTVTKAYELFFQALAQHYCGYKFPQD